MTIQLHKELQDGNIHKIVNGSYSDATARTSENTFTSLNIDKVYKQLDNNTYWVVKSVSSGIPSWEKLTSSGDIPVNTDNLPEGSINLYFTSSRVRATVLTGLSLATNAAITATNTVIEAFGLLQKQITDILSSKQDTLVSGTNIKTINSTSLLGSSDIPLQVPINFTTTGTTGVATFDGTNLNIPNYSSGGGSTSNAVFDFLNF